MATYCRYILQIRKLIVPNREASEIYPQNVMLFSFKIASHLRSPIQSGWSQTTSQSGEARPPAHSMSRGPFHSNSMHTTRTLGHSSDTRTLGHYSVSAHATLQYESCSPAAVDYPKLIRTVLREIQASPLRPTA